jgi:hypothetical protein
MGNMMNQKKKQRKISSRYYRWGFLMGMKHRSKVKFKSKWKQFLFSLMPTAIKIERMLKSIRLRLVNHKKFQLSRIDKDIEKYSNIPILDERINQYFNPKNCKMCQMYSVKHRCSVKEDGSLCSICCFASPSGIGCTDKFPSYKRLIDLSMMILKNAYNKKEINAELRQEFLELWEYRKNFYIKIKEILVELPKSRFSIRKFEYFPELWSLENA